MSTPQIRSFEPIVPMIYAYSHPDYIPHQGWTKIGYTEKNGEIYFELKNIAAADLDTLCTLIINGDPYKYSVLEYVKACLKSTKTSDNMKALAAATYRYNQAANVYFV